jgi:hypothetical protein
MSPSLIFLNNLHQHQLVVLKEEVELQGKEPETHHIQFPIKTRSCLSTADDNVCNCHDKDQGIN